MRSFRKDSPKLPTICECTKILTKMNKKKAATRTARSPAARPVTCECDRGKGDCGAPAASEGCQCGARALGGFGVTVDLSSFFSDERRECWVWVCARRPVSWLRARLAARLRLACSPTCLALLAPQGLLHPDDPLALLSPGDVIRVVPVQTILFDDESPICKRKLVVREKCIHSCEETTSPLEEDSDCESRDLHGDANINDKYRDNISFGEEKEIPRGNPPVVVTRAVVASPATRTATCSARLDPCPLGAVKQRALDLLNRYEQSLQSESPPPPTTPPRPGSAEGARDRAGRPRRRRVRRRPRLPAESPAPGAAAAVDIPQVCAVSPDALRDSSVVRNAAARTHARVVHAIGE